MVPGTPSETLIECRLYAPSDGPLLRTIRHPSAPPEIVIEYPDLALAEVYRRVGLGDHSASYDFVGLR